ncbi:MAG: 7-cyano-7-deazaguanine synthase QueC [Deltaproteobacteria bacterium]|nr:MAG: 7-cyano-7-deazaguanine synthase QueC [Deltaproteobacteria bacterium]
MQRNPAAVVLLSGGLDSTTVLAMAKEAGFDCYALTFDYGQKQLVELQAAATAARCFGCLEHRIVRLDPAAFGGSALTTAAVEVPKGRPSSAMQQGVPITYVPARNTIFLSYALALAETLQSFDIFIGANHVDYSGYPDCRPAFIAAFSALANVATKAAVEGGNRMHIHAPLMEMDKAQIVREGMRLGVDYRATHSCYDPKGAKACGHCDACQLRHRGFVQAGVADPTAYTHGPPDKVA